VKVFMDRIFRVHRQEQKKKTLEAAHSEGNPACCNKPRQKQESHHYQPQVANAKSLSRLYRLGIAYFSSTSQLHSDSNEYKDYLCEYVYGDSRWSITIKAQSFEDARARLKALSDGKVLGEVYAVIPAEFGWWAKFYTWFRNQLRNLQQLLRSGYHS
jgi:hypothetical protein